ncbi:MAG: hypothetical protein ACE5J3_08515 [Methanosarcinales archaeon]
MNKNIFKNILVLMVLWIFVTTPILKAQESESNNFFKVTPIKPPNQILASRLKVDGINANSYGIKIILRPYRPNFVMFIPCIVDVKFGLMDNKDIIYSNTIEQVSLFNPTELKEKWKVVLENNKNYTGFAQVFWYINGTPEYVDTFTSSFTAQDKVEILNLSKTATDASATLFGKSAVPFRGYVQFQVLQNNTIIETINKTTPAILADQYYNAEVFYKKALVEGTYTLKVTVFSNNGDILDKQYLDFSVYDDVAITDAHEDETGASVTLLGKSQIPYKGSVQFQVFQNGKLIENITKKSPVLMADDDETVEVTWKQRLPEGIYNLKITVIGNDGDILDQRNRIIESKLKKTANTTSNESKSKKTPSFKILTALLALLLIRNLKYVRTINCN